jgi:lipid II:glycine glycyltransferase (peptidoglycan interpeptide bridge formation enzyme)
MSDFSRNTRNEIRKATKEGVIFSVCNNLDKFITFYNQFAKQKGLKQIDDLDYFEKNQILITEAVYNSEVLCMHSYIIDTDSSRARLLHSASLFREIDDKSIKALVGKSNRFLHYMDMLHFKNEKFITYDLGGYAYNTDNDSLKNINKFKDSFGGELIENSNYIPIHYYIAGKIKALIHG